MTGDRMITDNPNLEICRWLSQDRLAFLAAYGALQLVWCPGTIQADVIESVWSSCSWHGVSQIASTCLFFFFFFLQLTGVREVPKPALVLEQIKHFRSYIPFSFQRSHIIIGASINKIPFHDYGWGILFLLILLYWDPDSTDHASTKNKRV